MLRDKAHELSDGVIRSDELYTIGRFRMCLRLTESAVRALRIAGLPVIRFGKRAFVSGRQAIEFLERRNEHRSES